ncbi:MAG TPA: hypothetical protein VEB66_13380, partial [Opitutaceae bacterium]|nr:hypothetical protein [Opitutaceae bacterium]
MSTLPWALFLLATAFAVGLAVAWRRKQRESASLAAERVAAVADGARRDAQLAEHAAAMRTQSDLLGVVCREVRGHLDGIIGSADLVLETPLQPSQRAQLVTLKTTGESLLYLLNDLQALSQAEFRVASGEREAVVLRTEMAEVIEVLAPRAALKGVEIVLIVEPDVPRELCCDDELFRQFVFNLLACVLRPTGPGALVVTVARSTAAAKPIAAGRVWLRFTAAGRPSAPEAEFTGSQNPFAVLEQLPLTIARRVTEVMGGEHGETVGSEAGPAFWFDLPMEAMPVAPVAAPDRPHEFL